jgi:beta-mannanase/chitodextrinase
MKSSNFIKKRTFSKRSRNLLASLFVLTFGLLGLYTLLSSHAATIQPIVAGNSKSNCIYLHGDGSALMTEVQSTEQLTGVTYDCLETFTNGSASWSTWETPWMDNASSGLTSWVNGSPSNRQLVITMDLIPDSVSNNSNPLTWEQSCDAGDYNTYAKTLASNLVAAGFGSSAIRLGDEMNGSWEIDFMGATTQEQKAWGSCFAQEVTAMRGVSGAHFLFDWNPNACVANYPFANWYPGDSYVDIVGVDTYDNFCIGTQPTPSPATFAQLAAEPDALDTMQSFAAAHNKPMSFPEWGTQFSNSKGLGDDQYYVQGIGSYIHSNDVAFQVYFDANDDGIIPLSSSYPNTLNAYEQEFAAAPAAPAPTVAFSTPKNGVTVSGNSVSVAASASVGTGATIKSVTIKANGTTLKTCAAASCTASWDTTALSNGSATLEADTTASDSKTATSSETVTVANSHPVTITSPNNLASPSQTTNSVNLTWNASSDSAYPAAQLTYHLLRNGTAVKTTGAGSTSATDSGLSSGTYYNYSVVGYDPAGNKSNPSSVLSVRTQAPNCASPAAPQGLSGKAPNPTTVTLSWHAVPNPSSGCVIDHYVVSRNQAPVGQPSTTSYTDSTATARTTYTYSVLAVETGNIAGSSSNTQVTTPAASSPDPGPSTPTDLTARAASSTQVNLSWNPSSDAVTGIKDYEVLRNGTQIGTTTVPSFGDSGLTPHTTYGYRVIAVSSGGKTASSAVVKATTPSTAGSGGSSGGHSSSSSIPILQGTTSVGSGSENGPSTSTNPTIVLGGNPTTIAKSKPKTDTLRTVAYLGGSTVAVLVLMGGIIFWFVRRRAARLLFLPHDPDLISHIVVGGDDTKREGSDRGQQ